MHPVIKHILERKNKSVPVNDGRKIALVLFGGIMCGIRGAGAMIALEELGLRNIFDSVYVISAGFPNVLYLLDEKVRLATSIYYRDLNDKKFINPYHMNKIIDIGYLMNIFRSGSRKIDAEKILNQKTKIYVGTKNVKTKQIEYLEIHDLRSDEVFNLLNASISVPFLHPGSTEINGKFYEDVGRSLFNSRAKINVKTALGSDATDILLIYNRKDQHMMDIPDPESSRVFEILPTNNDLGLFETKTEILKCEAQKMGDMVKRIFGSNEPIDLGNFD